MAPNVGGATTGHWLTVRLVSDPARKCPRDAIGSVVFVTAGGMRRLAEVSSGRGQMSSDQRPHFGLGPHTTLSKVEVFNRSGGVKADAEH
jgi:hypothetical protein